MTTTEYTDWRIRSARWLASWGGALALLSMRVWVAHAFWMAGLVKIADPVGTRALFESIYHVPLLPSAMAAMLGTWIELIAPWLLGLGLAGRLTALFLFVYNAIAIISYPHLWPHGLWAGLADASAFADHKIWAMMLLTIAAWGPGPLSADSLVRWLRRRH